MTDTRQNLPPIIEFRKDKGSEWIDITKDVRLNSLSYARGSFDTHPITGRIAGVGTCTFLLNNDDTNLWGLRNAYTPGHTNCLTGFGAGGQIRVSYSHNGADRPDFFGFIPRKGVIQNRNPFDPRTASITVYDWFHVALNTPVQQPEIIYNVTLGDVIRGLITPLSYKPELVSTTEYAELFPTGYDTVRANTTVLTEAQKAIESEMGSLYLRVGMGGHNEDLIIAGREYPSKSAPILDFAVPLTESDYLVDYDAIKIGNEDGDYLAIADYVTFDRIPGITRKEIVEADQLFNQISGRCYPREVGTPGTVLFTLNTIIEIAPGETTRDLVIRYTDPVSGSSKICGTDIIDPEDGTDYQANSAEDGTGSDLTAQISYVLSEGLESSSIRFTNNDTLSTAYLIFFQLRGTPIKINDVIEFTYTAEDSLITQNGLLPLTLDQKYQANPLQTANFVELLGLRYSTPINTFREIEIVPNKSALHAGMLMRWDLGDRIPLYDEDAGIDEDYIISGIRVSFVDNIMKRTFFVKPLSYDTYIFWLLGVPGYSELGITTILGFEE